MLAALLCGQQPTKEYIRLGDRVIAVENPTAGTGTVTVSPSNVTIGSLDTQQFSATPACGTTCWTIDNTAAANISTTGLLTPVSTISTQQIVHVTATVSGQSGAATVTIVPALNPSGVSLPYTGGSGGVQITTNQSWTVHSSAAWLHITSSTSGTGIGVLNYQADSSPSSSATITLSTTTGSVAFTVTEGTIGASVSVSTSAIAVTGVSGQASFQITASGGCSWNIDEPSLPFWIHFADTTLYSPRTDSPTAVFSYDNNPSSTQSRSGAINIVGCNSAAVTVSQSLGLGISAPSPQPLAKGQAGGSFTVTAPANTGWSASVDPNSSQWLSITNPNPPTVNASPSGTVTTLVYAATANNGGGSRSGNIIVGGNPISITQAGDSQVTITPGGAWFPGPGYQQFNASALGGNITTSANWPAVSGNDGTINNTTQKGLYSAPLSFSGSHTDTVTADATTLGYGTANAYVTLDYPINGQNNISLTPVASWPPSGVSNYVNLQLELPYDLNNFNQADIQLNTSVSQTGWPSPVNSCFTSWNLGNPSETLVTLWGNTPGDGTQQGGIFYNNVAVGNAGHGGTTLANSQCEIDLLKSSRTISGSAQTINILVLFRPGWAGTSATLNTAGYMQLWKAANYCPGDTPCLNIQPAQYLSWTSAGYQPPSLDWSSSVAANGSPVSGNSVPLSGWALDNQNNVEGPLSSLQILVDGSVIAPAQRGLSAPADPAGTCTIFPSQTGITPGWDCPNIGWSYNWDSTSVANGSHTVTIIATDSDPTPHTASISRTFVVSNGTAAVPVFSPSGGNYIAPQSIQLSSGTAGAQIWYTTDGSPPIPNTSTHYTAPISLTQLSTTVKSIASATGLQNSVVASATFTLQAAMPTFSVAAGPYPTTQTVALSSTTPGAQIYYTTNGNRPDSSSTLYSVPISVSSTETVQAIAYAGGITASAINSATYTIGGGGGGGTSYAYYRPITFNTGKVSGTQVQFPVLISGQYSFLATTANGGNVMTATGYDIVFAQDAQGTQLLPFERESYQPNGTVTFWVQVPSLSSSTTIYMLYGNSSATDRSNKHGTWDSNFKGVWHLANGTTLDPSDSTLNGNTGTPSNTGAATGGIFGSASFNGSSSIINAGNAASLQITGQITMSAWVNAAAFPPPYPPADPYPLSFSYVIGKGYDSSYEGYFLRLNNLEQQTGVQLEAGSFGPGAQIHSVMWPISGWATNSWHHVVGTFDGANWNVYFDGIPEGSSPQLTGALSSNFGVYLGGTYNANDNPPLERFWNGDLDEIRISNMARSSTWILTEYNNQLSPTAFYNIGAPQSGGGGTSPTTTTGSNASATYSTSNQNVTLSATVTSSGGTVNSGTVTFTVFNGTTQVGSPTTPGTVSGGSASATYTLPASTAVGSYTIQAAYSGATGFATSSDSLHTLTVNSAGGGNGYSYYRSITVNSGQVSGILNSFPMLVSGTYSYLKTTANGGLVTNANGYDIIFTSDAAGQNRLPFERESYSASTGAVNFWVQVSALSSGTTIYMFYGNSSVTSDPQNAAAVWDSNYKGVYHFTNGVALSLNDSTANGNTATNNNGVAAGTGKIGGDASSPGGQSLSLPFRSSGYNGVTVEAWFNASNFDLGNARIIADGQTQYGNNAGVELVVGYGGTLGGVLVGNGTSSYQASWTQTLSTGTWYHYVGVYDGSTVYAYLNGSQVGITSASGALGNSGHNFSINVNPAYGYDSLGGSLDEIRVSNTARTPQWIAAEYNNQNSPTAFYTVGSQQNGGSSTTTAVSNASATFSTSNQNVTLTATVTSSGGTINSGTVTFTVFNGSTQVGSPATSGTVSGGSASATYTLPASTPVGSYTIQAAYSGATGFASSSGNATLTVNSGGGGGSGYQYSRPITINASTYNPAAQSNFTVLVCANAPSGSCNTSVPGLNQSGAGAHVQNANGYDIVFSSTACSSPTLMKWEMPVYVPSTGAMSAWVLIPSLGTANQNIYMCYGNSNISSFQGGAAGSAWDSYYKTVYHMNDNAASTTIKDSSANANNATNQVNTSSKTIGGQMGSALNFNGSTDSAATNSQITLPGYPNGNYTISAWVLPNSNNLGELNAFAATGYNTWFSLGVNVGGTAYKLINAAAGGCTFGCAEGGTVTSAAWTYIVGNYSGATGTFALYVNGAPAGSDSGNPAGGNYTLYLGAGPSGGNINAGIQEVRLSLTTRSAYWITTEYNNQHSSSSFITFGQEQ